MLQQCLFLNLHILNISTDKNTWISICRKSCEYELILSEHWVTKLLYNTSPLKHTDTPLCLAVPASEVWPRIDDLKIELDTYEFPCNVSARGLGGFWLRGRQRELNITETQHRAPHFPATVVRADLPLPVVSECLSGTASPCLRS